MMMIWRQIREREERELEGYQSLMVSEARMAFAREEKGKSA